MTRLKQLRMEREWLRAKYDDGAVPPGVWDRMKKIESEIAWIEFEQQELQRAY